MLLSLWLLRSRSLIRITILVLWLNAFCWVATMISPMFRTAITLRVHIILKVGFHNWRLILVLGFLLRMLFEADYVVDILLIYHVERHRLAWILMLIIILLHPLYHLRVQSNSDFHVEHGHASVPIHIISEVKLNLIVCPLHLLIHFIGLSSRSWLLLNLLLVQILSIIVSNIFSSLFIAFLIEIVESLITLI